METLADIQLGRLGYGRAVVVLGPRAAPLACVRVVVPLTAETERRGLQGYGRLAADEGMLFLAPSFPCEASLPMWMAAVTFPVCMLWVSQAGRVVKMLDVQPGDVGVHEARGIACLETAAGVLWVAGVHEGAQVTVSFGQIH